MKLKHIALAALVAVSGLANAAPMSTGSDGNGGLFFSIWDANGSYTRNLNLTMDSFASTVGAAGALDLSFAADSVFTSFLGTADLASLKWNIVAGDNVGTRRVVETYSTLPATTIRNDLVRGVTTGTATFSGFVNQQLVSSDSTTFAAGTSGYAGAANKFGVNAGGLLNFSNAGTLANNSADNGMNLMLITGLATGLLQSTYAPYVDGSAVKVYLDGSNALHISAVTAVPEPESYAMLLAGLGLMGGIARRRNKNSA